MPTLRQSQKLPRPKKLTKEVVRKNPLLGKLARIRLKEAKAAREARKAMELDLD